MGANIAVVGSFNALDFSHCTRDTDRLADSCAFTTLQSYCSRMLHRHQVYDDTGGFFGALYIRSCDIGIELTNVPCVDHVIPPHEGVPADDAPCGRQNHGCPSRFDFRRLGNRVASFVMSPWIAKGGVIQEPTVRGNSWTELCMLQQKPSTHAGFGFENVPSHWHPLYD